ncbi:MAG: phosphoenolpyruvate-utilizing protein [Actinomycetia bacterium]|nr:phosphoenolpyruvate-utilizing protein [Actinomycetes bacterium]
MGIWKAIGGREEDGHWVGHAPSNQFPVYTRGNTGEVYPEVFTPLTFSIAADATELAMRNAMLESGLLRPKEVDGIPLTTAIGAGVFGGYSYLNLSLQRLASARVLGGSAGDADINFLGDTDPPPHEPLPNERNLAATLGSTRYVWKLLNTTELPALADDQTRVDLFLAELPDPTEATDDQLRQPVDTFMPLFSELFERHLKVTFAAGIAVAVLNGICDKRLGEPLLAIQLLAGLGDVDSAAPSQAMWDLSRQINDDPDLSAAFDAGIDDLVDQLGGTADDEPHSPTAAFWTAFSSFLDTFGSRGPNEWDTAFDTWGTDPTLALTLIDRMRGADDSHDPTHQGRRLAAEAEALEAECLGRLNWIYRWLFTRTLRSARLYSRSRERTKTPVVRAIHGLRLLTMELAARLAERTGCERSDMWLLLDDELDDYMAEPGSFAELIAERRRQHQLLNEHEPPFFFSGQQPPLSEWARKDATMEPLSDGQVISGIPGCPGVARGRARVVTNPGDPRGLSPGDVLVAPLTDPAWTPLFVPAEAVIVDVGAVMSHAVIVSRELGIPCVVSATSATKRIPDGAMVEVDGTKGTVTVLSV